jgi:hypothetical protein
MSLQGSLKDDNAQKHADKESNNGKKNGQPHKDKQEDLATFSITTIAAITIVVISGRRCCARNMFC